MVFHVVDTVPDQSQSKEYLVSVHIVVPLKILGAKIKGRIISKGWILMFSSWCQCITMCCVEYDVQFCMPIQRVVLFIPLFNVFGFMLVWLSNVFVFSFYELQDVMDDGSFVSFFDFYAGLPPSSYFKCDPTHSWWVISSLSSRHQYLRKGDALARESGNGALPHLGSETRVIHPSESPSSMPVVVKTKSNTFPSPLILLA